MAQKRTRRGVARSLAMYYQLYLLLVPGLLAVLVFKYVPLYGLTIAFKDFNIFRGIADSPWIGLEQFRIVFSDDRFYRVLMNTLIISTYKIIFLFPLPILLALMLNEIGNAVFKRTIQTVIYLPHFLSWVIVTGLFITVLGTDGIVNQALAPFLDRPIRFFMDKQLFRTVLVFTEGWKTIGWSTIVYLAAITSVDPQLYEAAIVDGANRFRQALHVTIPGMAPTIVLMLILRLGNILEAGFTQILAMYNPTVYEVADIIGTYVYRIGLGQMNFSYGTAVGLFNSVVAFVMIVTGNAMCKRFLGRSIW